MPHEEPIRGRGTAGNPPNRFIPLYREHLDGWTEAGDPAPRTRFYKDYAKTILVKNDSPDIPFTYSVNAYRGCEHGCVYCYARPGHEYLELSAGLDFESKIFIKENAPELLRDEFAKPKWIPQTISMSGVTDCYQPIERRIELTRRMLQVCADFRHPVGIVTKNALVSRDRDILAEMAKLNLVKVFLSITTLDPELAGTMEPRASTPEARLRTVRELREAGVPVGVLVAPVIPGLNDHEVPAILEAVANAGAQTAGYVMLRLPFAVKELFETWLQQHFPQRKDKILGRIRDVRGGKLNDSTFVDRMRGVGPWADLFSKFFKLQRSRFGLSDRGIELSTEHFTNGRPKQMELFS